MAREARKHGFQRVSLVRARLLLRVQAQLNLDGHAWRGNPPVDRAGGDVRQAHPGDRDLLVLQRLLGVRPPLSVVEMIIRRVKPPLPEAVKNESMSAFETV